eukprot:Hpha_TRINITY_DN16197_c3_g4::TRINITY_DN16197_c3_g4_i1::g.5435::m.5435
MVGAEEARGLGCGRRWQHDRESEACSSCPQAFGIINRRHHCRLCGLLYCADCTQSRRVLPKCFGYGTGPVRVCDVCAQVRLDSMTECWACSGTDGSPVSRCRSLLRSRSTVSISKCSSCVRIAVKGEVVRPGLCGMCGGVRTSSEGSDLDSAVGCFVDSATGAECRLKEGTGGVLGLSMDGAAVYRVSAIAFDAAEGVLTFDCGDGVSKTVHPHRAELRRTLVLVKKQAEDTTTPHDIPQGSDFEDLLSPPPSPLSSAIRSALSINAMTGWETVKHRVPAAEMRIERLRDVPLSLTERPSKDSSVPVRASAEVGLPSTKLMKMLSGKAAAAHIPRLPGGKRKQLGGSCIAAAATAVQKRPICRPAAALLTATEAELFRVTPVGDGSSLGRGFLRRPLRKEGWEAGYTGVAAFDSGRCSAAVVVPQGSNRSRVTLVLDGGSTTEAASVASLIRGLRALAIRVQAFGGREVRSVSREKDPRLVSPRSRRSDKGTMRCECSTVSAVSSSESLARDSLRQCTADLSPDGRAAIREISSLLSTTVSGNVSIVSANTSIGPSTGTFCTEPDSRLEFQRAPPPSVLSVVSV